MVELVRARVVQVFPLQVNLGGAQVAGQAFAVINGSGPPLELLADAAQFVDELGGMGDGLVSLRDFFKSGDEFVRQIDAAVFAEAAPGIRKIA
ncbi:hypothetical protein HMPREF3038_00542 [Akkermansia sp. KLE1797]|nr:hypothetical protein HMPREF3038_00542 [Akkermansia sp. KLE1797]KXU55378.1 hypothetical protein HMPREF3039_00485 [Akkermansia sp. KLE1798]KZA05843.1 hypothetical protein HMPREF1326_00422 [Akkermansia sp. KLE1605]